MLLDSSTHCEKPWCFLTPYDAHYKRSSEFVLFAQTDNLVLGLLLDALQKREEICFYVKLRIKASLEGSGLRRLFKTSLKLDQQPQAHVLATKVQAETCSSQQFGPYKGISQLTNIRPSLQFSWLHRLPFISFDESHNNQYLNLNGSCSFDIV